MEDTHEILQLPVTFAAIPGWTSSPEIAEWTIGEVDNSVGFTPPSIVVGRIAIIAGHTGHYDGNVICQLDLVFGDTADPPTLDEIELIRSWFGDGIADCIGNPNNAINGFKSVLEVAPLKRANLEKLARLAMIESNLSFDRTVWKKHDKLCPEIIEAMTLAVELGWTTLITNDSNC